MATAGNKQLRRKRCKLDPSLSSGYRFSEPTPAADPTISLAPRSFERHFLGRCGQYQCNLGHGSLHVSMRIRPQWGVLIYHSGLGDSSSISHREGRPKRRRFGHPAHGLRSSGGLRLWTACSGPPTTSRPATALRFHPPGTLWPHSRRLPTMRLLYPLPTTTQYPGATTLRSVRRGRRGTRERVRGVWRPTQRASHPRGGASVAECCGGLREEKEGVEGKRGTRATTLCT